jgi:membrane peptidoglycan carboxypeptidase
MVGGVDYFDVKNLWYNNMITSRLQPWSSFKPFVYALAMEKNNYWANSVFIDKKTVFPWWYSPNNADLRFLWKITLSRALNYSRNITAVQMYFLAWWENQIIKRLTTFGMNSLAEFKKEYREKYWKNYNYSAPMALWTAQITPIELAWAYTVFANNWIKNKVNPILKIINSKWNIIENFEDNTWIRVLSELMSYRMNYILSNSIDRPQSRNKFLTIPGRKLAAKTWTSSKQYKSKKWSKTSRWRLYRRDIIVPKNLWTIWYTPQITTVVWAWNTSWKELSWKAYGLYWAWPIMRDFMKFAHKDLKVENWKIIK